MNLGHSTSGRRLVLAAFWTNQDADSAVDQMADAIGTTRLAFRHSGEVVAIEELHVDADLRRFLGALNMPIVGAYPTAPSGQEDPPA